MLKEFMFMCLAIFMAFSMIGCEEQENIQNTDWDFADMDEYEEWLDMHLWSVGVSVRDEPRNKESFIYIYPSIEYLYHVDPDAEYNLSINERDIPLRVTSDTSHTVGINYDLVPFNISIKRSDHIHFVFSINGEVIINKSVLVPSDAELSPIDWLDLSEPYEYSWIIPRDADSQILRFDINYAISSNSSYGRHLDYFVKSENRSYMLNGFEILNHYWWGIEDPVIDNLSVDGVTLYTGNYEEQDYNVVYVLKQHDWWIYE